MDFLICVFFNECVYFLICGQVKRVRIRNQSRTDTIPDEESQVPMPPSTQSQVGSQSEQESQWDSMETVYKRMFKSAFRSGGSSSNQETSTVMQKQAQKTDPKSTPSMSINSSGNKIVFSSKPK